MTLDLFTQCDLKFALGILRTSKLFLVHLYSGLPLRSFFADSFGERKENYAKIYLWIIFTSFRVHNSNAEIQKGWQARLRVPEWVGR